MKRDIIKIDEDLCNGCGLCIPNCHEGALQIIDGKVRLISDLMCDGLGACIGYCPEGALTIEQREAAPYDEIAVIKDMIPKGRNTVIAHLQHLKEHNEVVFLRQGVQYLEENKESLPFSFDEVKYHVHNNIKQSPIMQNKESAIHEGSACGCPGAAPVNFKIDQNKVNQVANETLESNAHIVSELRQWPIQLHLLNPQANYFHNSDVLLAADCSAFAMGGFHSSFIKGKTLAIACPKLDSNKESYLEKLTSMIDNSNINTLTVAIMEVPCCSGLLQMAMIAKQNAKRNIPLKKVVISIQGEVLSETWM